MTAMVSAKINTLMIGYKYEMKTWNLDSKEMVTFLGFFDGNDVVQENPGVVHKMPQDWVVKVENSKGEIVTLTKATDGAGAMYNGSNRVTFFQTEEQREEAKQKREAIKASKPKVSTPRKNTTGRGRGRPKKTDSIVVDLS